MAQYEDGDNGTTMFPPDKSITGYTTLTPSPEFIRLDMLWGAILAVMSLIGTLGNILSIYYFVKKCKQTIHDVLYKFMSIVDTINSLTCWPVIIVLFATRNEMLFENRSFCGIWTCLFQATNTIALFLVMVISVSRTVSVIAPFHKLREFLILGAIGLYAAAEVVFFAGLYGAGVIKFVYYYDMGYCTIVPKSFKKVPKRQILWDHVFIPVANLKTLGPIFITFLSFVISVCVLVTRKTNGTIARKEQKIRKVSVTITMFTAIFLFCQLPLLITKMMSHSIKWIPGTPDFFTYEAYMGWNYSLFFQVVFPVLNSTLNPFLYYCRMPKYKTWMRASCRSTVATRRNKAAMTAVLGMVRLGFHSRKQKEETVCNAGLYDYAHIRGLRAKTRTPDYLASTTVL
jgi:hypothetical protein